MLFTLDICQLLLK